MPPFLKSLAFLKALTYVAAVVWFYFDPSHVVTDAVLLGLAQAILQLFGVTPELRSKGLLK